MNDSAPSKSDRQAFWVDRLSSIAALVLSFELISHRTAEECTVHYFANTSFGIVIAEGLASVLSAFGTTVVFEGVEYNLNDFTTNDTGPYQIRYDGEQLLHKTKRTAATSLLDGFVLSRYYDCRYEDKHTRQYLEHCCRRAQYDRTQKLSIVSSTARNQDTAPATAVFKWTPLDAFLPASGPVMSDVRLIRYPSVKSLYSIVRGVKRLVDATVQASISLVTQPSSSVRSILNGSTQETKVPRIAVRLFHGADTDARNDFFWFPDSDISSERVLAYVDIDKLRPLPEKQRTDLDDLNIDYVDRDNWRPTDTAGEYARQTIETAQLMLRCGFWSVLTGSIATLWAWGRMISLECKTDRWSAFFQEHALRVHLHNRGDEDSVASTLAMDRVGGIDVRYQWSSSHFECGVEDRPLENHVFFAWGPLYVRQLSSFGLNPDITLCCGHIYADPNTHTDSADRRRKELRQAGCEYVLCVFDNFGGYYTSKVVHTFYRTVVNWALADDKLGLVIKPKGNDLVEQFAPPDDIKMLKKQGRCLVLPSESTPTEAARVSDLTVGVGINSATIEAALAGVPGVHFDLVHMDQSFPFYDDGLDQFIFRNSESLHAAISAYYRGDRPDVGDHGEWLTDIDPFRDGCAGARIGMFLRVFLETLDQQNRAVALESATERYRETTEHDDVTIVFD